jgi:predicted esterase
MIEKSSQVLRTVRRYQSAKIHEHTKVVWIIFHGYGQLAQFFFRKTTALQSDESIVVVPEGPHRFYLSGNSGRVGASWMTKEWREQDIADNVVMIDELVATLRAEKKSDLKIVALGFSQGAATMMQWICKGQHLPDRLIIWAGSLPPDLNYTLHSEKINALHPIIVVGNEDEYFKDEALGQLTSPLSAAHIHFEHLSFAGGHDLDASVLNTLKARFT